MDTNGLTKTAERTTNEQEGKEMSMKNVVLIAGIHGVSGRAAAEHWTSLPGTRVYGLSRRSAPLPVGVEIISASRPGEKHVGCSVFARPLLTHGSLGVLRSQGS